MAGPPTAALTVKLWVTGVAVPNTPFPDCVAVTEQTPPPTAVTIAPATVQTAGVLEARFTARPELAIALIAKGDTPKITSGSGTKVIVCDADPPVPPAAPSKTDTPLL